MAYLETDHFPSQYLIDMNDSRVPALLARLASSPNRMLALDDTEVQEGYHDGRAGDPWPGTNRSDSYAHGWWTGSRDGGHRDAHTIDQDIVKAWRESGSDGI